MKYQLPLTVTNDQCVNNAESTAGQYLLIVYVFILFHREGFFRLRDVWDIIEEYGSMMLC